MQNMFRKNRKQRQLERQKSPQEKSFDGSSILEVSMPDQEHRQRERLEVKSFLVPALETEEVDEEDEVVMIDKKKPFVKNLDLE